MNSVFERKNPLAVVSAFREAFGGSADVQLAVKASRGANDPDNFARLKEACGEAGCVLIDRVQSREESYGLLNACDCYVSLHRSEGFGLTMAEAMFFGKPVIATGYSGNLDFMSADNSILIPYEKTPLPRDYMVYRKGCVWAEPSVTAAAEAMRRVVDRPAEARCSGSGRGMTLRRCCRWRRTAGGCASAWKQRGERRPCRGRRRDPPATAATASTVDGRSVGRGQLDPSRSHPRFARRRARGISTATIPSPVILTCVALAVVSCAQPVASSKRHTPKPGISSATSPLASTDT